MTAVEPFTVRPARHDDDPIIAGLVIEGFLDKFRPIFGRRMDRSVKVMEKWIHLEHCMGGVRSLVAEGALSEVIGSIGVRTGDSDDAALSRGIWETLRENLGFLYASWAAALLSYPRYAATSSEAYVERLVVSPEYHRQGMAHALLDAAETLALESDKRTIGLHVSGVNLPALKLYEAYGYTEVSRQHSLLTGHFLGIREWLYMRKEL